MRKEKSKKDRRMMKWMDKGETGERMCRAPAPRRPAMVWQICTSVAC